MHRAIALSRRLLTCARGSTLVGYSSLMLLFAIAAITVLGRVNVGGGTEPPRNLNALSSD
jgi:hypothetical protein